MNKLNKKFLTLNGIVIVTAILVLSGFFIATPAFAATIAATTSGNWSNTSTWVGNVVPTSGDDVIINPGITITIGSDTVSCNSISLMGTNAGLSQILISTGTLTVAGNISAGGLSSQIIFSDAGILNVGGSFFAGTAGTFTASTSTVNFDGNGPQEVGAYSYYNVTVSGSGGKTVLAIYSNTLTIAPGTTLVIAPIPGRPGGGGSKENSTTAVSSLLNPSAFGDSITFIATVTGPSTSPTTPCNSVGTPSGTVQFKIDGSNFGLPAALSCAGIATITDTDILSLGPHTVAADYSGDSKLNSSSGTLSDGQTVGQKTIMASVTASNKIYDGYDTATITGCSLNGVVGSDVVTCSASGANFNDKNAGIGKTVTATGITLGGANAGNYVLSSTTAPTTADITQRPITVTAVTDTKVFDGTTSSTGLPTITLGSLVASDTAIWTQTFDTATVGTNKTLTPAGTVNDGNAGNNYVVIFTPDTTGEITPVPASPPLIDGGGGGGAALAILTTPTCGLADINCDKNVNILDFNSLMVNWGSTVCGNTADIDGNCIVDIFDFNLLMVHWGVTY